MPPTAVLLRPTAARLALLGYVFGVALLWWLLPAQPMTAWKPDADTQLLGFLPDGQTLLSATRLMPDDRCRGPLRLWDIRSGRLVGSLLTDEDVLLPNIAVAPDGTLLAWRDEEDVHLLNLATREETVRFPAALSLPRPSPSTAFLSFTPDGGSLVYDLSDPPVDTALAVWDVAARRERFRLEGEGAPVEFTPDGRLLVTCTPTVVWSRTKGEPRTGAKVWDTATGKRIATLANPDPMRYAVGAYFAPDGDVVAVLNWSREHRLPANVDLWEVASGNLFATLDEPNNAFFLPEGRTLVSREIDQQRMGVLQYWDGTNGRPLGSVTICDTSGYRQWHGMRVSADRRWLVVRGQRDTAEATARYRLARLPSLGWLAPSNPPGTGQILIYDTVSRMLQTEIASEVFEGVLVSPDGKHLATVGAAGIEVWGLPPSRPWVRILLWPLLPALAVWLVGRWLGRRKRTASPALSH